jgi:hypothetical protein
MTSAIWERRRSHGLIVSAIPIAPLQDLLNLGSEARMKLPCRWEVALACPGGDVVLSDFQWLEQLTDSSNRAAGSAISTGMQTVMNQG